MGEKKEAVGEKVAEWRREQILDAAMRVFAKKGYHQAKTKEVAEEAGVSNGTVYNYFVSKEEILMGLLDRLNETAEREEQLASLASGSLREKFEETLRHRLGVLWPQLDVLRAVLPELLSKEGLRKEYYEKIVKPSLGMAEAVFGAMKEEGEIRASDPALTVRLLAASVVGLLLLQLLGDEVIGEKLDAIPGAWGEFLFEKLADEKKKGEGDA